MKKSQCVLWAGKYGMSLLRSVITIHCPPNCSSMLKLPDVNHHKMFQAIVQEET